MGWFGNRDDEFLDEDELRLRRESAKRNKKAHADCQANHSDDSRFDMSRFNIKPHEDCEADHSDDNDSIGDKVSENINKAVNAINKSITSNEYGTTKTTTYKVGQNGPTFRTSSYTPNGNRNLSGNKNTDKDDLKVVTGVITAVLFVFAFMMAIAIVNSTPASRRGVSVEHTQREVAHTTMNDFQREMIISILAGTDSTAETTEGSNSTNETRRDTGVILLIEDEEIDEILAERPMSAVELTEVLKERGYTPSEILSAILRYQISHQGVFSEQALALLMETEECQDMTDEEIFEFLREHSFVDEDISTAIDLYRSED